MGNLPEIVVAIARPGGKPGCAGFNEVAIAPTATHLSPSFTVSPVTLRRLMVNTMTLFLALLSLVSLAGAIVLTVLLARPATRAFAIREFGSFALSGAAAVAAVSTLGSLYVSELAGFTPCRLCWVQRGFMYPLAVFLILAVALGWRWAPRIGIPVAIVGALIALYHYAEQQKWIGGSEGFCSASSPCTDIWVQRFGFVSIPFMSLTGFLFAGTLLWLHTAAQRTLESR